MALPEGFDNPKQYFSATLDFLSSHAWIYQTSNTRYLKADTLASMPLDFQNYFLNCSNLALNMFPLVTLSLPISAPAGLHGFRRKLRDLIPSIAFKQMIFLEEAKMSEDKLRMLKMKPKKQYEVIKLAEFICKRCADTPVLVEFGAGLGYLSVLLYTLRPNQHILCLEADEHRVQEARNRCQTSLPQAATSLINYQKQYINEDSGAFIIEEVEKLLPLPNNAANLQPQINIVGLHACADLSIDSIKLFLSMPQVRRLIMMPCCYHKLKVNETGTGFVNFPLSEALNDAVKDKKNSNVYFNRPFLRLACQHTNEHWRMQHTKDHLAHGKQMYMRALAETLIDDENEVVVKIKQRNKENVTALPVTFAELCQNYVLHSKNSVESSVPLPWRSAHEQRFNELNEKYKGGKTAYLLAEGLTCLQTSMQKLCENIILYDRLCFIKEMAAAQNQNVNVSYEKLLDEKLSPRCYVLMAEKLQ